MHIFFLFMMFESRPKGGGSSRCEWVGWVWMNPCKGCATMNDCEFGYIQHTLLYIVTF